MQPEDDAEQEDAAALNAALTGGRNPIEREITGDAPFAGLTPDAALNALDEIGLRTTGQLLALNSFENRVFQVGVEDDAGKSGFLVAKFYRPGRWSDAQIAEEHEFTAELAAHEIPSVPPLLLSGRTLHHAVGFRCAVFPRRGGRAPNLDDRLVLERIGRFLGRLHALAAARPFVHRPALDVASFGEEPRTFLLAHDWLPQELREIYAGVAQQAIDVVRACEVRAGKVQSIRVHGDVHEGNVLWTEAVTQVDRELGDRQRADRQPGDRQPGPHFVDFDDARMAPAVQDLWMLLGDREQMPVRLQHLLAGYEDFARFDRRELHLVEALRTLRLIQYSAWIARRWHDPAFPAAFPWFDTPRYWESRILELREQIAAMQEPVLIS